MGTEGQGLSVLRNDGLKFKLSLRGVGTFPVKFLSIVNRMKQTKNIVSSTKECKNRMD